MKTFTAETQRTLRGPFLGALRVSAVNGISPDA